MTTRTRTEVVFESLHMVVGGIVAAVGLVGTLGAWFVAGSTTVPLWALVLVGSIGLLLASWAAQTFVVTFRLYLEMTEAAAQLHADIRRIEDNNADLREQIVTLEKESGKAYGKVTRVVEPHAPYDAAVAICLVEGVKGLAQGASVGFSVDDDGFERMVGIGSVVKVQADQRRQVIFERALPGNEKLTRDLLAQNSSVVARLSVESVVDRRHLDLLMAHQQKGAGKSTEKELLGTDEFTEDQEAGK